MSGNDDKIKSLTGTVTLEQLGGASKSKHKGFVLTNDKGSTKLRREDGNPFYDDFFEEYEGKKVKVRGYDMDTYFLVTDIEVRKSS